MAHPDFADRFDEAAFADNEPVEFRVYRGSRKASIYDEHVMPEDLFVRLTLLASAYQLHQLSSLDPYGPTELNAQQARRVAEEAAFIARIVNDPPAGWLLTEVFSQMNGNWPTGALCRPDRRSMIAPWNRSRANMISPASQRESARSTIREPTVTPLPSCAS